MNPDFLWGKNLIYTALNKTYDYSLLLLVNFGFKSVFMLEGSFFKIFHLK